jgi:flagellar motor switch/type III secretory pathway protein FliN
MKAGLSKMTLMAQNGAGPSKWPMPQQMPVRMTVKIPMVGISLRGLAALQVGAVIASTWAAGEEVPLYASNVTLSWCEFEVVNGGIAVRLTRVG